MSPHLVGSQELELNDPKLFGKPLKFFSFQFLDEDGNPKRWSNRGPVYKESCVISFGSHDFEEHQSIVLITVDSHGDPDGGTHEWEVHLGSKYKIQSGPDYGLHVDFWVHSSGTGAGYIGPVRISGVIVGTS